VFERCDVRELGSEEDPWHPIIEWYARAVTAMQERNGTDFSDPTCWRYLAEVHGSSIARGDWPRGATWNECQHSSWYFLPWHRIYLHYFERVVRQTVSTLGGPDDWALPYWNYSDPRRPSARRLPPAFREPQMPSGEPNPLFVSQRSQSNPDINGGEEVDLEDVDIGAAMAEMHFSEPTGDPRFAGFGGPVTGWNHSGGSVGSLENIPHGMVHVEVGGIQPLGWMSRFATAGRDPIFWLHHANIDRLWKVWLNQGSRVNPPDTRWLDMSFTIGSGASATTLAVRNVLDTTQSPLNYHYTDESPQVLEPAIAAAASAAGSPSEEERMPEDLVPEMVGASEEGVPLAATSTEVEVAIEAPSGPALAAAAESAQPRKVYLKVENVRGEELAASSYLVHVDLPQGADPAEYEDRRAGKVSMFGVLEASQSDEEHSGSGLTFSFDITGVVERLQEAGEWDPEHLRVTFTPVHASEEQPGNVSAGRVSLFYA
jgi:tyrosinase